MIAQQEWYDLLYFREAAVWLFWPLCWLPANKWSRRRVVWQIIVFFLVLVESGWNMNCDKQQLLWEGGEREKKVSFHFCSYSLDWYQTPNTTKQSATKSRQILLSLLLLTLSKLPLKLSLWPNTLAFNLLPESFGSLSLSLPLLARKVGHHSRSWKIWLICILLLANSWLVVLVWFT